MGLKNFLAKLAGKKIANELNLQEGQVETKKWYQSKTVLTAIVTAILGIAEAVGQATGHPINIPTWVYSVLGGLGLYGLRTGDKPVA